jgi:hypothetical protein
MQLECVAAMQGAARGAIRTLQILRPGYRVELDWLRLRLLASRISRYHLTGERGQTAVSRVVQRLGDVTSDGRQDASGDVMAQHLQAWGWDGGRRRGPSGKVQLEPAGSCWVQGLIGFAPPMVV